MWGATQLCGFIFGRASRERGDAVVLEVSGGTGGVRGGAAGGAVFVAVRRGSGAGGVSWVVAAAGRRRAMDCGATGGRRVEAAMLGAECVPL